MSSPTVLRTGAAAGSSISKPVVQPPTKTISGRSWRNLSAANSSSSRLGFGISGHLQPSRQLLTRQVSFSGVC